MLSVSLPDTSEMGFSADSRSNFVREDDVILVHNLGGEIAQDFVFFLECGTTFGSSGVETKHNLLVLITVSE